MVVHTGGRGKVISVILRPAWSTERVPGQVPKLQRNPVSKRQTNKKNSSLGHQNCADAKKKKP